MPLVTQRILIFEINIFEKHKLGNPFPSSSSNHKEKQQQNFFYCLKQMSLIITPKCQQRVIEHQFYYLPMQDKNYHTIDPLILETLNLNEKRMKRILNILHGNRDEDEVQVKKTLRSARQRNSVADYFKTMEKPKAITPAIQQRRFSNRNPSVSALYEREPRKKRNELEFSMIDEKQEKSKAISISKSVPKKTVKQKDKINTQQQIQHRDLDGKYSDLRKNYGQIGSARSHKTLEINPKDIYRLEIEAMVAKPTQISELEDAQQLMKRLKRRHQHLRKFDRAYYSKLNQIDLAMV